MPDSGENSISAVRAQIAAAAREFQALRWQPLRGAFRWAGRTLAAAILIFLGAGIVVWLPGEVGILFAAVVSCLLAFCAVALLVTPMVPLVLGVETDWRRRQLQYEVLMQLLELPASQQQLALAPLVREDDDTGRLARKLLEELNLPTEVLPAASPPGGHSEVAAPPDSRPSDQASRASKHPTSDDRAAPRGGSGRARA